jgi:hypothetical protein
VRAGLLPSIIRGIGRPHGIGDGLALPVERDRELRVGDVAEADEHLTQALAGARVLAQAVDELRLGERTRFHAPQLRAGELQGGPRARRHPDYVAPRRAQARVRRLPSDVMFSRFIADRLGRRTQ